MMKPRKVAAIAAWLATLSFSVGCDEKVHGQLMVVLSSSMPIQKDVAEVSVEIDVGQGSDETTVFRRFITLGADAQKLPASLAIVRGSTPGQPVKVNVAAWDAKQKLRIVANYVTTVPAARVAAFPVELDWQCYNRVKPADHDEVKSGMARAPSSDCPDGNTCVAGKCVSNVIDSSTLPDFLAEQFTGKPGDKDNCFDVNACLGTASAVYLIDKTNCLIDLPMGLAGSFVGTNIALALPPGGLGFCSASRCLIPLNGFSANGWNQSGRYVQLPAEVCRLLASKEILDVVVSTTCPTKTQSIGLCDVSDAPAATMTDAGADAL